MLEALAGKLAFRLQRAMIARTFRRRLGYTGDFENPKTYQEKLQFRKLYGNHAFYAMVADKFRVRSYVAERVGEKYLIPLLGVYDRLDDSIFESLPSAFVIKANHGCKWNRIVRDKAELDVQRTVRYFSRMSRKSYGWVAGERHYNFIRPQIVIEQLLRGADGELPWDYNFFCYNSPAGFDYSLSLAAGEGKVAHFDKHWNLLESTIPEASLASHARAENWDEMLLVARRLSADFDFVRADLYNVDGRVYFGELTCTPAQGFVKIASAERQRLRDEMWHLAVNNRLLYCDLDASQWCAGEWRALATGVRRGFASTLRSADALA
jgi:TupA-like ATPgrasp